MGKIVDHARTSRSTESSRTRTVRRASGTAAGSAEFGGKDLEELGQGRDRRGAAVRGPAAGPAERRVVRHAVVGSRAGEWADRLNGLPKYVVSSTLAEPKWGNATVLNGDVVTEVIKLKQEVDGDILVYASYQLVRTLIEHDLVDELRLVVFPVVLGAGERLFGQTSDKKPLRLVSSQTIGDGLPLLTYDVVRDT